MKSISIATRLMALLICIILVFFAIRFAKVGISVFSEREMSNIIDYFEGVGIIVGASFILVFIIERFFPDKKD